MSPGLESVRLRLLSRMGMSLPRIDLQLGQLAATDGILREHSLDREAEHPLRFLLQHLARLGGLESALIAAMPVVHLLLELLTGEADLGRIDDDDEVAGIHMGREMGPVLSSENASGLNRESSENLVFRVDHQPFSLYFPLLRGPGLHETPLRSREPHFLPSTDRSVKLSLLDAADCLRPHILSQIYGKLLRKGKFFSFQADFLI